MKKLLIILSLSVIFATLSACDKETEEGRNDPKANENEQQAGPNESSINPVSASDEVVDFFRDHLSEMVHSELPSNVDQRPEASFVINSADEFSKIASSEELPFIDFEEHTLILGQFWVGGSGYRLSSQDVVVESGRVILNLSILKPTMSWTVMEPFSYWGLYPKLPEKPLEIREKYETYEIATRGANLELEPDGIISVKFKSGLDNDSQKKVSRQNLTMINSNKLGYIDIAVPLGVDIDAYISQLKESGEFESIERNGIGEWHSVPNDALYMINGIMKRLRLPLHGILPRAHRIYGLRSSTQV